MARMKACLILQLATIALAAITSAANIKEDSHDVVNGGGDTQALVEGQLGWIGGAGNQQGDIRKLTKRSPKQPNGRPIPKKKLKKKIASIALISSKFPPAPPSPPPPPPPVFPPLITQSVAGPLSIMGAVAIVASILMAAAFYNAQNNRRRSSFDYGYARSDDYVLNGYNYGDVAATASKIVPYLESAGQVYKR